MFPWLSSSCELHLFEVILKGGNAPDMTSELPRKQLLESSRVNVKSLVFYSIHLCMLVCRVLFNQPVKRVLLPVLISISHVFQKKKRKRQHLKKEVQKKKMERMKVRQRK